MLTSNERLERQIEKLIRDHLVECRDAAAAAVARAFTAVVEKPKQRRATQSTARATGPRRNREELAAIAEKLYEAVCIMPGEKMTVLAAHLGVPSRSLRLPAKRLKETNRVRTVGQRQHMRYFPMPRAAAENPKPLSVVGRGA